MTQAKALTVDKLYRRCPEEQLPFTSTAELEDVESVPGQQRALDSIRFGMHVDGDGFNLFALGPSGLGKLTVVREMVTREAASQERPPDWCYINNFDQPHRPKALRLPPGDGRRLRIDVDHLLDDISTGIPAAFESEHYQSRVQELEEELKERQANTLQELGQQAREQGIALLNTPGGFAFAPMGKEGGTLRPEQFRRLPEDEQKRIEQAVGQLQERLQKILRQFPIWYKETREKVKALNREIAELALGHLIDALKDRYREQLAVLEHLDAIRRDVIEHVDDFRGESEGPSPFLGMAPREQRLRQYRINVLVDRSEERAAPVVYEDMPSHGNLIGRIEHQAHLGALVTDFTLIKPGALHRANGGYLVLDVRKVLTQPFAWESLKRTLQAREVRIESLERTLSLASTTSLEPEPIPLEVKVVLVGERLLYYLLQEHDPEFSDLFKVAADFEDSMERRDETSLLYARLIATLARRAQLRPVARGAVARLVEHSARLAGDAEKLSTHLGSIADVLREANYWAEQAGRETIEAQDIQRAVEQQVYRAERVRRLIYEEIRRGTLLIDTSGEAVGQINGLSVMELGKFAFGRPARITATARLGEGKVIDIERETELGGAIHSKGVLILSNFLAARYASGRPLSIAASLVFEQSYGMVEGDSASVAELCALLSALSGAPIRQALAVTGSVNQLGHVQPIGGVNEKIEGFFDVCNAAGLTGDQGVLIPASNVKHLMLRHDVVEAARAGRFHIYPMETVDDALELLTALPAGVRDAAGTFPPDSVNGRVEARLSELSELRERFGRKDDGTTEGGNHD